MVVSAAQITDTLMHQSPRISATAVAALLARLPRRQELLAPLAPTTTTRSRKPINASPSRLVAQLINPHHLRPTLHTPPPLLLPIANTIDAAFLGAPLSLPSHRAMSTVPSATSPPTSPPAKRHKPSTSISETVANDTTTTTTETTMSSAAAAASSNDTAVPTLEQSPSLLVKKLSDKAKLPTRGSAFAAGYDLYAAKETVIPKRGKALVDTDISIAVPAGTCKAPFYILPLALVSGFGTKRSNK